MSEELKTQVRLYCILGRKAPVAVVFRRGPSKQVLLMRWHTDTDEFYEGQWFKGRIYERRCDLSPSGERLIYFAANYKQPYFSWTAVSKPPFLTALALWPKGDGWGGGGLFENEHEILLNHRPDEMQLADGFKLPRHIQINPFGERPGWGEDSPIIEWRLSRDGWQMLQDGEPVKHTDSSIWMEFSPALVWSKPRPSDARYELQMHILGLHQREGPWYIIEHFVQDRTTNSKISLGRTDWADWCHSGDLLFANNGRLFRLRLSSDGLCSELDGAKLLIDLTSRSFNEVTAPADAKQWGGS